jgi:type I restriction enzyme S subunit
MSASEPIETEFDRDSEASDSASGGASAYPPSVQPGIPKLGRKPDGWTRAPIGEFLKPVFRPAKLVDDERYQLVTAKRSRGGIVPRDILFGRDIRTKTQFLVEAGDFLISRRQISHGACGIVPQSLDGAIVSNEYVALKPKASLDLRFLSHLSHSVYFQQTCFHSSIGVHVEKLVFKLEDWLEWEFDIPPLAEQRRLADIFDTWDRVISTTEAQANAKRHRFHWLYSQLLPASGASLPEGWKVAPITNVAAVRFSGVDKKTVEGETPVFLCNYTDVFNNRRITADLPFMAATAKQREIEAFSLWQGDVVFTKDSETAEDIGASAVVTEPLDNVICGYHLGVARAKAKNVTGDFLAYALRHPWVREEFRKAANGVTRFGLNLDVMDEVHVLVSSIEKQKMIAAALHAVEDEIDLLTKSAASLRLQKKGLMQRLFSGDASTTTEAAE